MSRSPSRQTTALPAHGCSVTSAQTYAARGAEALLDDLSRRAVPYLIAISTSAELRSLLIDTLGWTDLPVLDADAVEEAKPAPDLLLKGCRSLGVDPQRATILGDSPWDAEAAHRVGMRCVAVRCGGFGDDTLLRAGASVVEDDPQAFVGRL